MRKIIHYLSDYISWTDKRVFSAAAGLTALLIFLNYHYGLNDAISHLPTLPSIFCWMLLFAFAFGAGYLLESWKQQENVFRKKGFLPLFLLACALFAWKMTYPVDLGLSGEEQFNNYLNTVIYWPFKLAVVTTLLYITWKTSKNNDTFYGVSGKNFTAAPYLLMLLLMVPLIALAASNESFHAMYPRYQNIAWLQNDGTSFYKLLFELSYGSDFFSIELFFRGFLVLGFMRWAGKGAILPMAMFYCTIHFGKPLGECISSFFGGLLLGVVTYNTRTILGGLMVHLGIAWMMELAGHFLEDL
jgi:hypothetical protein